MKTKEQAAREYAETKTIPEAGYILNSRNAFLAGVEYATRWIPVEEGLPDIIHAEKKTQFLIKGYYQDRFGRRSNAYVETSRLCSFAAELHNRIKFSHDSQFIITHWRNIE